MYLIMCHLSHHVPSITCLADRPAMYHVPRQAERTARAHSVTFALKQNFAKNSQNL